MTSLTARALATAAWLVLAFPVARAADEPPPKAAKADPLAAARAQIAKRDWAGAIAELERVNASTSADWNNLMGYCLRKRASPDLAAAERHYDTALRIDPKHRGALEYSGELYLMTGRLDRAEQQLAVLDKLCFLPCEEYTDLKKAVERHKAGSSK